MIQHLVLMRMRSDAPAGEIDRVIGRVAGLKERIDGIESFVGGPYSSPEGLHRGYTHGFVMVFTDAAARDAYLPHPDHQAVVADLLPLVEGGVDGVLAFDFEHGSRP